MGGKINRVHSASIQNSKLQALFKFIETLYSLEISMVLLINIFLENTFQIYTIPNLLINTY